MELLEVVLLLLAAVLASAVLDQLVSRVSLPLVQMGMGICIALIAGPSLDVQIESELFLVLFIAPLLFDESRRVSKRQLAANLPGVLSLAIGLVLATVLAVGFLLHWLVPSVPLAAAFALGAALGPTDAVAVSALAGSASLKKRQRALLSGEALINDASGIVSFQFAVAAATTGMFSVVEASGSFAVLFFGGIAVGLLVGALALGVIRLVRNIGLDGTTFHVTFEVMVPFAAFLLAEEVGASGILSVVAAGLLMTLLPRERSASQARVSVVSSGVWEILSFLLNGVVFVLLGMQLPQVFMPSWNGSLESSFLVGIVLAMTAAVVIVRFAWVLALNLLDRRSMRRHAEQVGHRRVEVDAAGRPLFLDAGQAPVALEGSLVSASCGELVRDALVTTLAGPKGAVTLSIAFTLPLYTAPGLAFPYRSELIFVASGVIVFTLLLANFVVPLLAPGDEGADSGGERALGTVRVQVLQRPVEMLRGRLAEGDALAGVVLHAYQDRLSKAGEELDDGATERRAVAAELAQGLLERQRETLAVLVASGNASEEAARACTRMVERAMGRVGADRRKHALRDAVRMLRRRKAVRDEAHLVNEDEMRAISDELEQAACSYLSFEAQGADPARARMARLWLERRRTVDGEDGMAHALAGSAPGAGSSEPPWPAACDVRAHVRELEEEALQAELEAITDLRERGEITRMQASTLRNEVYVLQMSLADEE